MADESSLKVELLREMLRHNYIGRSYGNEASILSKYSGKKRKEARKVLQSMATSPDVPVANYRDKNYLFRILSAGEAKKLIENLGGDPDVESKYDDLTIKQHG